METVREGISGRVMDLLTPVGKGQRGLIVAPPAHRQDHAVAVDCELGIDQPPRSRADRSPHRRAPEEVTDMQRSVKGEVISSTFDEPAARHVQVAEMVIEKAKRLVEHKRDVVILLDSITRLARAYNTIVPPFRARCSPAAWILTHYSGPSAFSARQETLRKADR